MPRNAQHRPRAPRGPHRRVRLAAQASALALLASLLVVLPAPRVEAVETMVVETRAPTLAAGAADAGVSVAALPSGEDVAPDLRDPARLTAGEEVEPFSMLGVTVPAPPGDHMLARARVGGEWGPWMELEASPDHRPEGAERKKGAAAEPGFHTAPMWVDGADAYQLSLPPGVPSVEVHLLRPEVREVEVALRESEAAAAPVAPGAAAPAILTRAQWGARAPKATPSYADDLKLGVVHHSVNANGYAAADVPRLLRGIQTYHMDVQGWNDIAYNFAVDRFGRIWEARGGGVDERVIGGHAAGFNTFTTGVMVLGDFTSATPSQASVDAVAEVLGWKFAKHRLDPRGTTQFASLGGPRYPSGTVVQLPKIVGHRDVGQTGCPGSQLHARLGEIRAKATAAFDRYILSEPEEPVFGDFDGDGLGDVLRYRPGGRADVLWARPGAGKVAIPLVVDGLLRPAVGDFDGDGRDDIFWHGPGSHYDRVWYGRSGGFSSHVIDVAEHGWPHVAELDGDGRDDIVLYAPGAAPDRIYLGQADRTMRALPLVLEGTYELMVGDFDGDGRDDLFLYGKGNRSDTRAFSRGNGSFENVETSVSGWYVSKVGDFDGNGRDDVLWYGPGAAWDSIWWSEVLGGRGAYTSEGINVKGTGYRPTVGDVNGDGRDDVLWYQPGAGADPLWGWPLLRQHQDRILSVGGTYVADIGRYTADGMDDIGWLSDRGWSYLWTATGGGTFQSSPMGTP